MAGTTIVGKSGAITLPGTPTAVISFLTDYSLQLDAENYEQTALGDNWRSYVAGLKGFQGKMSGYYVTDQDVTGQGAIQAAFLAGNAVTVQYNLGQGRSSYEGNVNITQLAVGANVRQLVSWDATFVGNGSLQYLP
jgi:hypothetical protein